MRLLRIPKPTVNLVLRQPPAPFTHILYWVPVIQFLFHTLDRLARMPLPSLPITTVRIQLIKSPQNRTHRRQPLLGTRINEPGLGEPRDDEGRADAVQGDVVGSQEARANGTRQADEAVFRCGVLWREGEGVETGGGGGYYHVWVEVRGTGLG